MKALPALADAYRPRRIHTLGVWPLAGFRIKTSAILHGGELLHVVWISTKDDPGALVHPPPDHNAVCIWDLALQTFEREAWIACVLANPDGPDLERYLATTKDFEA